MPAMLFFPTQQLAFFLKFFLHRASISVFCECELTPPKCPGIAINPGAPVQGRRGGESESPEEEAIEIGNNR
jgi:hypothetical protein